MFGMGMGEVLIILVVALLAVGPEKLPGAAKKIGKGIRDLRAGTRQLTRSIENDTQLGDAMREIKSAFRDDPLAPQPKQRPTNAPPGVDGEEPPPTAEAIARGEHPAALAAADEDGAEPGEGDGNGEVEEPHDHVAAFASLRAQYQGPDVDMTGPGHSADDDAASNVQPPSAPESASSAAGAGTGHE